MNFSTWNTVIFGIIWIVNVSVDYFRLKVFSRGPDPKREGLHKWGARGLKCHPFPPNSGDQLQPLVASSRGIPILSRIASASQWAKKFGEKKISFTQRLKSTFFDICTSWVAPKKGPVIFFFEKFTLIMIFSSLCCSWWMVAVWLPRNWSTPSFSVERYIDNIHFWKFWVAIENICKMCWKFFIRWKNLVCFN